MKLTSTNITLIASQEMEMATIGQNGKTPAFVEYRHLEELRDLLNLYFEQLYGGAKNEDIKLSTQNLDKKS